MTKAEQIILECTRLAEEFTKLPENRRNTQREARAISKRMVLIPKIIKELKEQLLFEQYLELQSKEWKEDIIGYESFKQPGKDICIKVNFTWGWLRVYRNKNNDIEWY